MEKTVRSSSKPSDQHADHPDFWDKRFQSGHMPWQDGEMHSELPRHLPRLLHCLGKRGGDGGNAAPLQDLRILIPGCGHAFEAIWFARLGAQVVALDFSATAIARARQHWPGELIHADFFTYAPQGDFDLIFERAFLCALPRRRWPDYVRQCARLLKPGGGLAGFFFYGEENKGPPFAANETRLQELFAPTFTRADDRAVQHPLPIFPGERWQVWLRQGRETEKKGITESLDRQ
jgi:thiopurine S-methyltransferase